MSTMLLSVYDLLAFEYEFFIGISRRFPFLKYLTVLNLVSQKHKNIHLPKLIELYIDYEHLLTVDDNLLNKTARANCARVVLLHVHEDIVYPKHFYSYFPLFVS